MDLSAVEPYFDRNQHAAIGVFISPQGDDGYVYQATGALVVLGGREFVLTAGHNVWDKDHGSPFRLAMGLPKRRVNPSRSRVRHYGVVTTDRTVPAPHFQHDFLAPRFPSLHPNVAMTSPMYTYARYVGDSR